MTTVSEITEQEFYSIGPKVTRLSFPDKEMKWFKAENGNIIAKLVLDRIEKTWVGHVWIRIDSGEHHVGTWGYAMAGELYTMYSDTEVEKIIHQTIEGIMNGDEYKRVVNDAPGGRTITPMTGITFPRLCDPSENKLPPQENPQPPLIT